MKVFIELLWKKERNIFLILRCIIILICFYVNYLKAQKLRWCQQDDRIVGSSPCSSQKHWSQLWMKYFHRSSGKVTAPQEGTEMRKDTLKRVRRTVLLYPSLKPAQHKAKWEPLGPWILPGREREQSECPVSPVFLDTTWVGYFCYTSLRKWRELEWLDCLGIDKKKDKV